MCADFLSRVVFPKATSPLLSARCISRDEPVTSRDTVDVLVYCFCQGVDQDS